MHIIMLHVHIYLHMCICNRRCVRRVGALPTFPLTFRHQQVAQPPAAASLFLRAFSGHQSPPQEN